MRYQKGHELLLPKAAFRRLVREVAQGFQKSIWFQGNALDALQEAAEAVLINELSSKLLT